MFAGTVVPKVQKQLPEVFCKKAACRYFAIFIGKHLFCSLFLIKLPGALLKKTPAQVFPCEYFEIHKNTYFGKHLRTAVSVK